MANKSNSRERQSQSAERLSSRPQGECSASPVVQAMQGELRDKPLSYIFKVAAYYETTGHLEVGSAAFKVVVQFGLGKPVFAISPIGKGDEAILDLFSWRSGKLSFISGRQPDAVNVQEPWETLVERGLLFCESLRFLEENAINESSILTRSLKVSSDELAEIISLAKFYNPQKLVEAYGNIYGTLNLSDVAERSGLSRSEWVMAATQLLQLGLLLTPDGRSLKRSDYDYSPPIEQVRIPTFRVGIQPENVSYEFSFLNSAFRSLQDPQTKALDRIPFLYMLAHEFARAQRFNLNLTLVVFSIEVECTNDLIPLEELCSLLRALEQSKREVDILGHFGERSFALLLPSVDVAQANVLVDRIDQNLHKVNSNFAKLKPSIYFGLASAPSDAISLSALCDVARYRLQEAVGQKKHRI
ncbi:MAG: DUF4388 domain-containing protein [Candidatus Melainabacteria bacterium]|nr:DUF4388 domain-containing protein [Candidatus Melainabacteria bacterium]